MGCSGKKQESPAPQIAFPFGLREPHLPDTGRRTWEKFEAVLLNVREPRARQNPEKLHPCI